MTPLFSRLNLKHHRKVCVLDAPDSFHPELQALAAELPGVVVEESAYAPCGFALAFCVTRAELDFSSHALITASRNSEDPVLWIAYPKGTSKRYRCEFNRDRGWDVLQAAGFDGVRMVAIDGDWSALRFRRTALVKTRT